MMFVDIADFGRVLLEIATSFTNVVGTPYKGLLKRSQFAGDDLYRNAE